MAGIVTVLLIARCLSANEQGYYYTFYSVVALQVVFELGFSFVVLQLAAHERARLIFLPNGKVEGDAISHSRLASVLQTSVRWYSIAGVFMACTLLPAGFYFFKSHQTGAAEIAWRGPWCLLVVAAMLAFQIDPIFSFLEGCGFVAQVAQRRLTQGILGSALAWAAMVTHHGLYSAAMVILGQVAVGIAFLLTPHHRRLLGDLHQYRVREHHVGWRHEIWPFQWRIAVSWLCGYFITQLFSPVLFAFRGPVEAGRMGMSLNIASGIGTVGMAWIMTKASPFGAMVARGQFVELDRLFFRTLLQSTVLLVGGAATFFSILLVGAQHYPRLAMRVLPPWGFGLLLICTIMNHVVSCEAIYLRAHKQEPFLVPTLISAALVCCTTFLLGKYFGANAIVVGLFVQGVTFALPSTTYIFMAKRREWHCVRPGIGAEVIENQ